MKNLLKKILVVIAIVCTISIVSPFNAFADGEGWQGRTDCPYFLGLTSWDCKVPKIDSEDSLKKNVWVIASNIAIDITVIAAYLVLGYVIYGGYLYTFSGGEPGKVATGRKALAQAFIGLAIVMTAHLIMASFRIALVGEKGNIGNCATAENACVSTDDLVNNLITWFTAIAGVASAIFLVYGGIMYITSSGDSGKLQKAKQMITYSLIGLAIVAFAIAITAFVSNMIRTAEKNAAYLVQTTIIKGGE